MLFINFVVVVFMATIAGSFIAGLALEAAKI